MATDDILNGRWRQIAGQVKSTRGMLTDDDLDEINGRREALAGKIQEHYGIAADEAKRQIREFRHGLSKATSSRVRPGVSWKDQLR